MKPKIFVFSTSYFPFVGGAEIAIREVAKRLSRQFDFFIITSRFRRDLPKHETLPEGTVVRIGFGTGLDKWLFPLFVFWNFTRPPGLALWGMDISQGSLTAAILKLFFPKIPFIFTIQYGYGDERLKGGRLGLIGVAFRFILRQADHVTAISTYLKNLAGEYGYSGPASLIYNGVDVSKFQIPRLRRQANSKFRINSDSQNPKSKVVITASRLVPKNGVDILIRAIAEVKKNIPDVRCHILGDGPERQKLENLVDNLNLKNEVKFFGFVPYDDLPVYLNSADIFVRPSRSEGMGNSFIEALAAGLPIIGTPVGGITDIIEDGKTGLFAKVDDDKDLAQKIQLLLRDDNLSQSIVYEGRRMIEDKFSWNVLAAKYGDIFEKYAKTPPFKILIATPIYPPQIGGPALYAKNFEREFRASGHEVFVADFGQFLKYPSGIRHLFYFFRVFKDMSRSDIILALDSFSAGLPAALASFLLKKPLILRLEGDFLWEHFVERARREITLADFYSKPQLMPPKERLIKIFTSLVIRRASRVVFSSKWRQKMFAGAAASKSVIINNVWPKYSAREGERKNIVLWAGRMIFLKNLARLIESFSEIRREDFELHLVGDGPERNRLEEMARKLKTAKVKFFPKMSHDELLNKFSEASFFILPSLSDVGPNVIAEAVAAGLPFIMTKESGYAEIIGEAGLLVDPLDKSDISEKMKMMMNQEIRKKYREKIASLNLSNDWREAAGKWLALFQEVINSGKIV